MKIFHNWQNLQLEQDSSATVGSFDGVHLGHQQLIRRLRALAYRHRRRSTIVTFEPHPKIVLGKGTVQLITDLEEKLEQFRQFQIDRVLVIPFTPEFARLDYETFVKEILLDRLRVRDLVIGYDHHFGRNREGTFERLIDLGKRFGFSVERVGAVQIEGEVVSSSRIRQLLKDGQVEKAATFLGRPYRLKGRIVEGDGRGKDIGFPTANIEPSDPHKIIPARGVYAVDVKLEGQRYKGMMNIGYRPTFNNIESLTSEVHIFNFQSLIYGKEVVILFKKFIRPEQKFRTIEALKTQLRKDKEICEKI